MDYSVSVDIFTADFLPVFMKIFLLSYLISSSNIQVLFSFLYISMGIEELNHYIALSLENIEIR